MNRKQTYFFLFIIPLVICWPSLDYATEFKPWYARSLQLEGRLLDRFQFYPSVDAPHKEPHYSSYDHFIEGSLGFVFDPFSFQIETVGAHTKKRHLGWDHISLTGRYLWLDDDKGDKISLSTGVTLGKAWRAAVNDISSFHHGQNEVFLHLAVGKQVISGSQWLSRWWSICGIGTADRWTPWIVADCAYEWSMYEIHCFKLYVNTLWGCGNHKLKVQNFGGYGPINHRSIDIGMHYSYELDCGGIFCIDYARRVYAHNFPEKTNQITFCFLYPFGPEGDYLILKAYTLLTGKTSFF